LGEDADKRVSEMSGGMKRRLSAACAAIIPSKVLILDEPFSGLDHENREKLAGFIKSCSAGRIVLLADHSGTYDNFLNL